MNLIEFHARQLPGFVFAGVAEATRRCWNEDWLGLQLSPGASPQIIIENVMGHRPLRSQPPELGWFAYADAPALLHVELRGRKTGAVLAKKEMRLAANEPQPVYLPWPDLNQVELDADLILRAAGDAPVFL
ncbi:MAG TPA: hypothetical protein VHB73_01910, partial [Alphaproteobacteria bacterium]|nr:hypothetical protein [Alphaproteobacteria bacterium]